ncbi:MAG: hypothetical protein SOW79_04955, partial [Prevotella sp.]|nr:hypothetical protein [Prevotella sp.]
YERHDISHQQEALAYPHLYRQNKTEIESPNALIRTCPKRCMQGFPVFLSLIPDEKKSGLGDSGCSGDSGVSGVSRVSRDSGSSGSSGTSRTSGS